MYFYGNFSGNAQKVRRLKSFWFGRLNGKYLNAFRQIPSAEKIRNQLNMNFVKLGCTRYISV